MAKQVLVVEDNEDILKVLAEMLEVFGGYEVTALSSGSDVLPSVENQLPDLILMDIVLGDTNGGLICQQIKNNTKTSKIKIILMSASNKFTLLGATQFNPDGFIEKPFSMLQVLTTINEHLA